MAHEYEPLLKPVLQDLINISSGVLEKHIESHEKALEIAVEITEGVQHLLGGVSVYIPKTDVKALFKKYEAIYKAWKAGESYEAIGDRHNLVEQRVRQIIHSERQKRKERREALVTMGEGEQGEVRA